MACRTVSVQSSLSTMRASIRSRSVISGASTPSYVVGGRKMMPAQRNVRMAAAENEVDVEAIVSDLQDKWEKVENKPGFIIYSVAAFAAVWLSSTVVNAINAVPLLPKMFELVGLGYSAWFTYRYLLFKSNREELLDDIEVLKKKIAGDQ